MISERDVADGFSSVWHQIFPMLTPNYIRGLNESQIIKFAQNPVVNSVGPADVISEMAYVIAKISFEKQILIPDLRQSTTIVNQSFELALKSIRRSRQIVPLPDEINNNEIDEAFLLANNIQEFINFWSPSKIVFSPALPGYGILNQCYADIALDDTLFEIKTIIRNFRSKDLKQLMIYLALQSVTGQGKWTMAGLYNPRLGVYTKFNVNTLVENLSGYDSSQQAFREFLNLLTRDVQIERRF